MEKLSHIFQMAIEEGLWKPIDVGGVKLSHLFFTDDLVLFEEASPSQSLVIKDCLENFCVISSEQVNYKKSILFFSKSVDQQTQQTISTMVDIPVTLDCGSYLGVPTTSGKMTKENFNYLLEKVTSKLRN